MKSELWQRLRAARDFADLKQSDVSKVCNVSRPAISQWESKDPTKRTTPSIEQLKVISKLSKVPIAFFLDDNADPSDVWKYKTQAPQPLKITGNVFNQMDSAFIGAVKFNIHQRRPELVQGFDVGSFLVGDASIRPDFALGKVIVELRTSDRNLMDACSRLLMYSKYTGGNADMSILICGDYPSTQLWEDIWDHFDIMVKGVRTPEEAADYIIERF